MAYALSLLDKSPIPPDATAAEALSNTVALARRAEDLGYKRFWVAEHHGSALLANVAPEVLAAYLLAVTRKIRIGTGGVMLQHYSPFKVAEVFRVLENLAPGRVDLGVGKAPGGLPAATRALQSKQDQARKPGFDAALEELDGFLRDALPEGHLLAHGSRQAGYRALAGPHSSRGKPRKRRASSPPGLGFLLCRPLQRRSRVD
jgi:luciferase family oxidoreductase group 1